jgi:hypothetical protein
MIKRRAGEYPMFSINQGAARRENEFLLSAPSPQIQGMARRLPSLPRTFAEIEEKFSHPYRRTIDGN